MNSLKHQNLVDTSQELFFKHGIKRITVEEICKKAGVSKVTFYKYFKNKKDLAAYIKEKLIHEGFEKFDAISKQNIPFPEKIDQMTQWKVNFFSHMSSDFITDMFRDNTFKKDVKNRFLNNIQTAQTKGEIRPDLNIELIWLVSEKLGEIGAEKSWQNIFNDYGAFQKQLRTIFFYGLLVRDEKE